MLHVHRSQSADGLADVLRGRPADPFAVEVVAVPAKGVERWLTQRLSHVLGARGGQGDGVCANVAFPHPSGLVAGAVATTADILPAEDPWERGRLLWTLLEVIDECAAEDWCSTLAGHLGVGDETAAHRRGRRLTAAQHLARLFDSYGADRPSMLRAWATGDDTDGVGALVAYGGAVSSRVASGVDLLCRCRVGARWRTSVRQHRTVGADEAAASFVPPMSMASTVPFPAAGEGTCTTGTVPQTRGRGRAGHHRNG